MTAQDLFGALTRWTGLTIMVYSLWILFIVWPMGLAMFVIGGGMMFLGDDIADLAYLRKRILNKTGEDVGSSP